jgi:hypothetical protein
MPLQSIMSTDDTVIQSVVVEGRLFSGEFSFVSFHLVEKRKEREISCSTQFLSKNGYQYILT